MARDSLPPGVTAADVDGRMAEPNRAAVAGSVTISATAEVNPHASHDEVEAALLDAVDVPEGEVLHVEVAEVER